MHSILNTPLPSSPRFLKGLQVAPVLLSDEMKAALAVEPSPGGVQYIIATQVRPASTAGTSSPAGGPRLPHPTVSISHGTEVAACCSSGSKPSAAAWFIHVPSVVI